MVKDYRKGESLWYEWPDDSLKEGKIFYYTVGHIDVDHPVILRALASAIQRDGLVDSLGQGYSAAESSTVTYVYGGYLPEDREIIFCNKYGETMYGDFVDEVFQLTLVELDVETY